MCKRRITNGNCFAAGGRLGLRKTPVGRALCAGTPFVVFFSATVWAGDICFAKSYNLPKPSVT